MLQNKFVRVRNSKWSEHNNLLPELYYNAHFIDRKNKALKGRNLFVLLLSISDGKTHTTMRYKRSYIKTGLFETVTGVFWKFESALIGDRR